MRQDAAFMIRILLSGLAKHHLQGVYGDLNANDPDLYTVSKGANGVSDQHLV